MCGFTCVVKRRPTNSPHQNVIPAALLRHRGPDFSAEIVVNNVAIRHWRLSIIDLSDHANQPIIDGDDVFVFNGELYDFKEIGSRFGIRESSDTRTFLSLLKINGGFQAIQHESGFYSFLRLSKHQNEIFGGRDRFGKKPLFYYIDDEIAIFSSEEKGILPFIPNKKIDADSIGEFLLYKSRFFGRTCFEGITEIAPGASFTFQIDKWAFSESHDWSGYYSQDLFAWFPVNGLDSVFAGDQIKLAEEFRSAVNRRIKCDVPVQVALSGGMDSAAVLAIANNSAYKDNILRAITVGFKQGLDESARAQDTAGLLGVPQSTIWFDSNSFVDQIQDAVISMAAPLDHPHALSYLLMCSYVGEVGKVLLTGEGADELFFGYDHYQKYSGQTFAFREYLNEEDFFCFENSAAENPFDVIRDKSNVKSLNHLATISQFDSRNLELKSHLISLLQRNDRMSMAKSVEIRSPFLDPNIVALALRMDPSNLLEERKQFISNIVKQLIPDLPSFGKKNGFRVPFHENYHDIISSKKGMQWMNSAKIILSEKLGIRVRSDYPIPPKLGWSLINIGCFVDEFELK